MQLTWFCKKKLLQAQFISLLFLLTLAHGDMFLQGSWNSFKLCAHFYWHISYWNSKKTWVSSLSFHIVFIFASVRYIVKYIGSPHFWTWLFFPHLPKAENEAGIFKHFTPIPLCIDLTYLSAVLLHILKLGFSLHSLAYVSRIIHNRSVTAPVTAPVNCSSFQPWGISICR